MLRKFIHLGSFARSLREVICVREICPIHSLFLLSSLISQKGMSSVSGSVSLSRSGSESERSGGDMSSRSGSGSSGQLIGEGRILMETTTETREDPPEELAESSWTAKAGYRWVAKDVRTQHSLFRWSRVLKSWLNCIPIFERGVWKDIVALERVRAIDCVCHGQEEAFEKFFYMNMCHFLHLYARLSFNDFTIGVLRLLNVGPTQLHLNSWAYLQAFKVLCRSLYLQPSPQSFLYFYDTRPKSPTTWLSLISRP